MAERLVLDMEDAEKSFFDGRRLWALIVPYLADYRFCWLLNHRLNFNFYRRPEMDIPYEHILKKKKTRVDLFPDFQPEPCAEECFFSVYEHKIMGSTNSIYLYENRKFGVSLVNKVNQKKVKMDYFILFPDSEFIAEKESLTQMKRLNEISAIKEIDLNYFPERIALLL